MPLWAHYKRVQSGWLCFARYVAVPHSGFVWRTCLPLIGQAAPAVTPAGPLALFRILWPSAAACMVSRRDAQTQLCRVCTAHLSSIGVTLALFRTGGFGAPHDGRLCPNTLSRPSLALFRMVGSVRGGDPSRGRLGYMRDTCEHVRNSPDGHIGSVSHKRLHAFQSAIPGPRPLALFFHTAMTHGFPS